MAYRINKVDIWSGEIDDRAGGLAARLAPLAAAGVDLQFVVARRQPHLPGKGIVFLGGVKGAKAAKAAAAAGLTKAADVAGLRVEGPNKPGDCYRIAQRVADAGLTLRGLSASVIGNKYTVLLAFDSAADADAAARAIRAKTPRRK